MTRRTVLLGLLAIVGSACSRATPLASALPSAASLAEALLQALANRDRAALEALALSEREFREHVWPELPAARPERNLPFSYVWGDLRQKSLAGLVTVLADHGGKRYQLQRLEFSGETRYSGFVVHRTATFTVREAGGSEQTVRVCGSMIDKNGAWKVFSYVVDD